MILTIGTYVNYIKIERHIVTRERLNGSYSALAYLLGHFVVEVVMIGMLSLVCMFLLYSLVGLNPALDKALFWALTLWLSLLVSESIMILIAAIVPQFIVRNDEVAYPQFHLY